MLAAAGYVVFFTDHMIGGKRYFIITAAGFVLACAVFLILIFKGKMQDKKTLKVFIIACIVIVVFQVVTLPAVNLFSQTLPVWQPRGTIFQIAGFRNSISQNEVGLMMRYYLGGKTLYAKEDYPRNSHNGNIFITDEYEFAGGDYPILTDEEAQKFYSGYDKTFRTINVQENPKLKIASFRIAISIYADADELVLLTDEAGNWYFMTPDIYKEAFGE